MEIVFVSAGSALSTADMQFAETSMKTNLLEAANYRRLLADAQVPITIFLSSGPNTDTAPTRTPWWPR
jgi:hypothetical protein